MRKLGKKSALRGAQKEYFLVPDSTVRRDLPLSVTDVHPALISILQHSFRLVRFRGMGVKFQLRVKVLLEKYSFENNTQMLVDVWFPSNSCSAPNEIRPRLGRAIGEMMSKFEAFVQQGYGWVVREVKVFSLTVNTFVLFSGGQFCSALPPILARTRACISIGGECDEKCFLKCIVAEIGNTGKNVGRWNKTYGDILKQMEEVSTPSLRFPVDT